MTRDPLYWYLVLSTGALSGILGYFKADKDNFPPSNVWWLLVPLYFFMGLIGAVAGAVFVGPLLQMSWQLSWRLLAGSPGEITWPQPVSLQGLFLVVGTWIGTMAGVMTVLLLRRLTTSAKR
ncbi:MAG TPA: hypothetical protein VJL90_10585 [Pseudorhodoplanes sp.]|nr:hypothetical protein [Pseudorhodoplanes sp.]